MISKDAALIRSNKRVLNKLKESRGIIESLAMEAVDKGNTNFESICKYVGMNNLNREWIESLIKES